MSKRDQLSVSYDPGNLTNSVAVILQCPGAEEDKPGVKHPAAGETGQNLSDLLSLLRAKLGSVDLSKHLHYDKNNPQKGVRVCNAHDKAYYKNSPNGEKPGSVVCSQVRKVAEQIKDRKLVICFGKDAAECFDRCVICEGGKVSLNVMHVVKCCHVGNKGLNRMMPSACLSQIRGKFKNAADYTDRMIRLLMVADYIAAVIQGRMSNECLFGVWLACMLKDCKKRNSLMSNFERLRVERG